MRGKSVGEQGQPAAKVHRRSFLRGGVLASLAGVVGARAAGAAAGARAEGAPPFLGKFRGVVTDTGDPLGLGRLRALVPDVLGSEESGWALPCVPFAGDHAGFFAVPAPGTSVWIEFEGGDASFPVWTGCFWASPAQVPVAYGGSPPQQVVVASEGGQRVTLDDAAGGKITLATATGQTVALTSTGIRLGRRT